MTIFRKINWFVVIFSLILVAGLILLSTNLKPRPMGQIQNGRLRVVATFFPLYDFTKNIGRDKIDLTLLFTQTPEVASFTPADVTKINQADVVIKNGIGFEPILDDLIKSGDNKNLMVMDTSTGAHIINANPHIWLNPENAVVQVTNISEALAKADPANANFYKQNAADYIRQLNQVDAKLARQINSFSKKDFVSFHPAFSYFAERYGLNQAAVFEEFPGKEPSPKYLSEVISKIKELKIAAIFAEPQFSPKVVEAVANDLGLAVRSLDPMETGNIEKDSYLSLMEKNLQTLEAALK